MSRLLISALSKCEKRQKKIVSKEKGMKHTANNLKACNVRQYEIDGGVITGNQSVKCDYLVLNDDKRVAYFIELKRTSHISEAVDQIQTTIEMLKAELPGYIYHGRIVSNAIHGVRDSKTIELFKKYRKKYKGIIDHKSKHFEENI